MRGGTFLIKLTSHPPCSIPFLSVLHQNKASQNFYKSGQRSIVERNMGLEYALPSQKFWIPLPLKVAV